jgi:hypothetical protein
MADAIVGVLSRMAAKPGMLQLGGTPSYVSLQTCLQMGQRAR